jgi:hypothetical protein
VKQLIVQCEHFDAAKMVASSGQHGPANHDPAANLSAASAGVVMSAFGLKRKSSARPENYRS